MKLGLMRRILAMSLCVAMLAGDCLTISAETVSGSDAVEIVETTEETPEETTEETTEETAEETTEATTEAATEETAEETTEETAEETTEETTVSGSDLVEIEEEETPLEDGFMTTLDSVTVDGVTITVSGPSDAFEEGTVVTAVAVEPQAVALEAVEENEQEVVKYYKAFDINLEKDGEAVQPLNGEEITVHFEGDMLIPDTDNDEDVAVYHVGDDAEVTKMNAEVTSEETVEMTTTHFSTYTIVITGGKKEYNVTYKHLLNGEQFYKPSVETVKAKTVKTYTDLKAAGKTVGGDDYELTGIKVIFDSGEPVEFKPDEVNAEGNGPKVEITGNTTIELSYAPITKEEKYKNAVIFYDYSMVEVPGVEKQEKSKDISVNENEIIKIGDTSYKVVGITGEELKLQELNASKTMTIPKNGKVSNVTHRGEVYEELEYVYWGEFRYCWMEDVPVTKKAGINDFVTKENIDYALTMGHSGDLPTVDGKKPTVMIGGANADIMEGGKGKEAPIVKKIAAGLSPDLKNVVWGKTDAGKQIVEPGYFTMNDIEYVKKVYAEGFQLAFEQEGNRYQLYSAQNNTGEGIKETFAKCQTAETYDGYSYKPGDVSGQFFPLDKMPEGQMQSLDGYPEHNWYFGMRYDFSFKLGDYIGPLDYTFVGDDDLWVFVDGELVLDLGGIHSAYPTRYDNAKISNTVDLWSAYFGVTDRTADGWWNNITSKKYDPNHEYQVTVLYMERGAYASSCFMDFVLPNVESKIITQNYGSLSLVKQDSESPEKKLADAGFTLYMDAACENVYKKEVFTNENGELTFGNITAGTYYMKETTAPEGYEGIDTTWKVVASEHGLDDKIFVAVLVYDEAGKAVDRIGNAYVIKNTALHKVMNLNFRKQDSETDKDLSGAEFILVSKTTGETYTTNATGPSGKFSFEKVPEGVYELRETKSPVGYAKPAEPWIVEVLPCSGKNCGDDMVCSANNQTGLHYHIIDGPSDFWKDALWSRKDDEGEKWIHIYNDLSTEFSFTKVEAGTNAPISKVTFNLYTGLNVNKNAEKPIMTSFSDKDGKVTFKNIVAGTYLLTETKKNGYEAAGPWIVEATVNSDTQQVEIALYAAKENGAVYVKDGATFTQMVIENTPEKGALIIEKSVDKVELVHGSATFTYRITCPNGDILYRTITFTEETSEGATKQVRIADLPVGYYTVEELDTLRYECESEIKQTKEVTAAPEQVFHYDNKKVFENYYSHTDVVVNKVTFIRNEDGEITESIISPENEISSKDKTSTSD